MSYSTVIFDLDGTLIDTIGSLKKAINIALSANGYPEHDREGVRSFINFGSVELVKRALPEGKNTEEEVRRVHDEFYMPTLMKYADVDCVAYDGIAELVDRLAKDGIKIAVLTNKPNDAAKLCINTHLPRAKFATVRGMVPDKFVKPDAFFTNDVMKEIGAEPETTLFVGDSVVDVKTAHNAGLKCAGVTWGFHGDKGFGDQTPDFIVNNAEELYKLIKESL